MSDRATGWLRPPRRRWQALAALLLAGAGVCCEAGQASAPFKVTVDLIFDPKNTAACDRTIRAGPTASVTLICAPSRPVASTAPRFMLDMYDRGQWLGTVDGMMTTGTVTSWRVIHLVNRDYLEIMVGW